jgi:hydroxymethylbilane synthase
VSADALRLGTRRSRLALAQSQLVADAITASTGRVVELVEISTLGDESAAALSQLGGTGVFVSALRERLLAGDVDIAVHSLKDLPTADAAGIRLAAVPQRADSRDALVARDGLTLGELPAGSTIGTGSPRRAAQLLALGLDLQVVGIRGNVDTRLRKVSERELDAVVLARAGLARLGLLDTITETLDPLQVLPAPGQGALAVEVADAALAALLAPLDDPTTRAAVTAERALLAALEAGCTAPVGALAEVAEGDTGPEIYLRGAVIAIDGSDAVRLSATGPATDPEKVGRALAAELVESGAGELLGERS